MATRTALALHAEIQPRSAFDRKHYFYGDLPAGYQITQNYGKCLYFRVYPTFNHPLAPFARNGYLKLHTQQKRIRIKQIQLEQDTAKSTTDSRRTFYDLNRAGMPLLEIVSHPDIRTLEEAGDYVKTLQAVLQSIGVSDGMMEAVGILIVYFGIYSSRFQGFASLRRQRFCASYRRTFRRQDRSEESEQY